MHRHSLRRVAIIDFDVHHGNGTEAVVENTTPAAPKFAFSTPYCDGNITVPTYRPWLDETDHEEVFFASVPDTVAVERVSTSTLDRVPRR